MAYCNDCVSIRRYWWNEDQNAPESVNGYPAPNVVLEETEVVEDVCSVTDPFPEPSINVLTVDGVVGFEIRSSTRSIEMGSESLASSSCRLQVDEQDHNLGVVCTVPNSSNSFLLLCKVGNP